MTTALSENLVIERFNRQYSPEMAYNRVVAWKERGDGYDIGYSELAESPRLELLIEDPRTYEVSSSSSVSCGIRGTFECSPGDEVYFKFMAKGNAPTPTAIISVYTQAPDTFGTSTIYGAYLTDTWAEQTTGTFTIPSGYSSYIIGFRIYGISTNLSFDRVQLYKNGVLTRFPDDYFQSGLWSQSLSIPSDGRWKRYRTNDMYGAYGESCPVFTSDSSEGTYAVQIKPSYEMHLEAYALDQLTNMRRGWLRYQMDIRGIDLQLFDKVDISYLLRTLNLTGDASVLRISDASYDIDSTGSKTSLTLVNAAYEVVSERLRRGMGSPSLSDLILAASGK